MKGKGKAGKGHLSRGDSIIKGENPMIYVLRAHLGPLFKNDNCKISHCEIYAQFIIDFLIKHVVSYFLLLLTVL